MKRLALFCIITLLAAACKGPEATVLEELSSPDGKLRMSFIMTPEGTPQYSLCYGDETIIRPSGLGFELRGSLKAEQIGYEGDAVVKTDRQEPYAFNRDFTVESIGRSGLDETWTPVWGEEDHIRNHYNELSVDLLHKSGKRMTIRFRLYDDGLGFRYEFPQQREMTYFVIKEELTEFALGGDYTAWWIPGDYDTQEYEYMRTKVSGIGPAFDRELVGNSSQTPFNRWGVQTALLMKTGSGLLVTIHEAACVDYATMHLLMDPKTLTFTSWLTPSADGFKGHMQTPRTTPWRTVQVAPDGPSMLSSRLVLNLNDPCAYDDVSWIHPVKYMGVWWEMIAGYSSWSYTDDAPNIELGVFDYSKARPHGKHGATNANVRKYIDFASEHGFDAVLVEGWNTGWEDWANCGKDYVFDFVTPYPDFDIKALNDYAHKKGVKLVMHHETSSSVRNYERHMEAAYSLMNKYGYDAVKSGYVGDILPEGEHHYSQFMINHYHYCITEAVKHHIMVNAHEAVRPTGLCRTWPNMIGNESARGTEFKGDIGPNHVTILPFTRLQGGPMDYPPGIFEMDMARLNPRVKEDDPGRNVFISSTIARQLALYVTMYSPLQMAADLPEHYAEHMDAFQFIKDVAVDWQRSEYLYAEPGDYLVVARQAKPGAGSKANLGKDGHEWFVGGVTDESAREFEIDFSFLEPGRVYTATIYEDAADANGMGTEKGFNPAYSIRRESVTSGTRLTLRAAKCGGFAISLM